ncbi:hypothetical protein ABE039_24685 [Priestia megaterium]
MSDFFGNLEVSKVKGTSQARITVPIEAVDRKVKEVISSRAGVEGSQVKVSTSVDLNAPAGSELSIDIDLSGLHSLDAEKVYDDTPFAEDSAIRNGQSLMDEVLRGTGFDPAGVDITSTGTDKKGNPYFEVEVDAKQYDDYKKSLDL